MDKFQYPQERPWIAHAVRYESCPRRKQREHQLLFLTALEIFQVSLVRKKPMRFLVVCTQSSQTAKAKITILFGISAPIPEYFVTLQRNGSQRHLRVGTRSKGNAVKIGSSSRCCKFRNVSQHSVSHWIHLREGRAARNEPEDLPCIFPRGRIFCRAPLRRTEHRNVRPFRPEVSGVLRVAMSKGIPLRDVRRRTFFVLLFNLISV